MISKNKFTIPKANRVGYIRMLYICKGESGINTLVLVVKADIVLSKVAHFTVSDTFLYFHLGI